MIGANLTTATAGSVAAVLDSHMGADGKKFIYVNAGSAIAQYDVVAITELGVAVPVTKALADDGHKIAVAQVAIPSGEYSYVQTCGPCTLNVLASCAADVALYTSATGGSLDDTATSQTKILGIVATVTDGGSGGPVAGFMANDPLTVIA